MTLKNLLEESREKYGEKPALTFIDAEPLSYERLYREVSQLSHFLHLKGVVSGDRVVILSENMPNWGVAYFAITALGAIAVPILPDFQVHQVHHIIRHSGCKAIFVSKRLYEKIEDGQFDNLKMVILIDDLQPIPKKTNKDALSEIVKKGNQEFARLKEAALKMTKQIPSEVQEDDVAAIIYTSGTTGHSKGVMLTHKNIVFDASLASDIQPAIPDERFLSILPLSHTYECTIGFVAPLMRGACVYYLDKPPTPKLLLQALQKVRPILMLSVPLVIEKIYKTRILPQLTRNGFIRKLHNIPLIRKRLHLIAGKKLQESFGGELRFFGIGGALLAPEVEKFLRDAKFPYGIGYGLTETSPLIAGSNPAKTKFRSTGPSLPGVQVKIANPNPETGEGEILVKGDNVMKGYYNDPERTAEVFTEDGWLRTGDLGVLDRDGYLFIKGRLKNMFLGPSGENIYPEEIEAIINETDYVLESLVFQQHDKIMARIHLNYEELEREFESLKVGDFKMQKKIENLLEELRNDINSRLPAFSRIWKVIEQTEPFEKTPTQKTKRYLYVE